jgi:hypothetical protein
VLYDQLPGKEWWKDDDYGEEWGIPHQVERPHYTGSNLIPDLISDMDTEIEVGDLPDSILEEVGLSGPQQTHLITMNDDMEANFTEIADWIEENL